MIVLVGWGKAVIVIVLTGPARSKRSMASLRSSALRRFKRSKFKIQWQNLQFEEASYVHNAHESKNLRFFGDNFAVLPNINRRAVHAGGLWPRVGERAQQRRRILCWFVL